MSFNPDHNKQAQEVILSRKLQQRHHPPLFFNDIPVNQNINQKHLEMILESKLSSEEYFKEESFLTKVNKTIGLLHRFQACCLDHLFQ